MRDCESRRSLWLVAALLFAAPVALADDPPAAESSMVRLLKSGRVAEDRQGTILEMIGRRGGPADLGYVFERALKPDGFSTSTRRKALEALADAALTRKARPKERLDALAELIQSASKDEPLAREAVRLAGLWKVASLVGPLKEIAGAPASSERLRTAAFEALATIGEREAKAALEALASAPQKSSRLGAVAALARLDAEGAAKQAAALVREADRDDDLAPLLSAFLTRKDGAELLASAFEREKLNPESAKVALRSLYALGRGDAPLVAVLNRQAGIDAEVKAPDKAEQERLVAEVAAKGDSARGEAIFRRPDLNCVKCHSVAGAGGTIGPDLSAVGVSSPVDYLINSVLVPDLSIKETFQTKLVATNDGRIFQGIQVNKDDSRLVLREASGETRTIPIDEIDETKDGGSLMPKGLVNFMTHAEFLDLVRFLSELGKAGPYAIHTVPTVQRWRVLKAVPDGLVKATPDEATLREKVLGANPDDWGTVYAWVSGDLPLKEVLGPSGSGAAYLQTELEASLSGPVQIRLNSGEGVRAWLDDRPLPGGDAIAADLSRGRHTVTFRVDPEARKARTIKVEVIKPVGSATEFTIVGGR